ncbi:MAG: hypothetical protein SVY15_01520 [Halobacteriota archaeon]|nr:hypothetical protein [Halobacteriota archaeon]
MYKILMVAKKEVKRRFILSIVVGIVFGLISALVGSIFFRSVPIISFGISVLVLNFALFLIGAGIISEERSSGTFDFLRTLPIRGIEIVLGKLLGLMVLITPALLVNTVIINSISRTSEMTTVYSQLFALFLYLAISASILIFASSQFERLPMIFISFIFYLTALSVPGAYLAARAVAASGTIFVFPIFIAIFSFFLPFVFGINEFLSEGLPLLASILIRDTVPGVLLNVFETLPEDPSFVAINIFSPLWHYTMIGLLSSDMIESSQPVGFISVISAILTVVVINLLTSLQLRRGRSIVILIFLAIAMTPLIFGFI